MDGQPIIPGFEVSAPVSPRAARVRCEHCGAGYVASSARERAAVQVARQRATAPVRPYAKEWAEYVARHPDRVAVIVAAARVVARHPRPTMDGVWVEAAKKIGATLDHNVRSHAARWLMATCPDLAGVFKIRSTPGNPERAR
jgi:hypothetical protein